ncbi:MAG: hypothetical protein ACP5M4_07280 [Acidobacteriaceae bacterium]
MAQKHKQRSAKSPVASTDAGLERLSSEAAERVREMIAGRHSKAALQLAKELHKREATIESENLLVEAYCARIEDLLNLAMTVEARTLIAIVRERFPAAAPRLAYLDQEMCLLDGRLDGIVGPLGNPELASEERERIETFIRQRIDDLHALASVPSLPPEHPMRRAAAALAAKFQAVTEGPTGDDLLKLPEVSRRSPLASWKALVLAIACYHRYEDAECRKWLGAIAEDSMPARLIRPLTAMMGEQKDGDFSRAESKLVAAAGDREEALRSSLAALQAAFASTRRQPILDAIRAFSAVSLGADAALRERLRQHIAVRCIMLHIPRSAVDSVLAGPPRSDAYFYRLLARSLEESRDVESAADAVAVWEAFRGAAIREKWFTEGGIEDGVLSLHMAELVATLPLDLQADVAARQIFAPKGGKEKSREEQSLAEVFYERACQADPGAEVFEAWLRWAKKQQSAKTADKVAERWREARVGEIQPLLHLMESAEKRNALKKALKYLEEAEAIDRLNPAVRRAKARLLISSASRHLREGKTHLVSAEIEHLLSVPEVRSGDIAALAAALRWSCAAVDGNIAVRQEKENELADAIGPVTAELLLAAFIGSLQLSAKGFTPLIDAKRTPPEELLRGAIRACLLGNWVGLSIPLLFGWTGTMIKALEQPNPSVDTAQLLVLGEAALADSAHELAYAVSSAGLRLGTANAQFLFLRACVLPYRVSLRQKACLRAALELARRDRDTDLAGKILDYLDRWPDPTMERSPLSPELLNAILDEERQFERFPRNQRNDQPRYAAQLASQSVGSCDCPECRARRGEPVSDWDDDDEDDEEFDDSAVEGLPGVFASIVEMLPPLERQRIVEMIESGADPLEVIDRIDEAVRKISSRAGFGRGKPSSSPSSTANRSKKNRRSVAGQTGSAPEQQPEQSKLF